MKKTNLRKLVAGASAVVMATGMAATIGMGAASAEGISSGQIDGKAASFTRTVSSDALVDGEITVGEEIQITNTIQRKVGWLVSWAQDNHPNCIEAVPNTSTWTVSGKTYSNSGAEDGSIQKPDEITTGDGWAKIDGPGAWEATPLTWTQTYTVTCAPGELNTGGLAWNSTGGGDNKADAGPTITVKAKPVNPDPGPGDGDGNGNGGDEDGSGSGSTGSLGSLGSIFGSLS